MRKLLKSLRKSLFPRVGEVRVIECVTMKEGREVENEKYRWAVQVFRNHGGQHHGVGDWKVSSFHPTREQASSSAENLENRFRIHGFS